MKAKIENFVFGLASRGKLRYHSNFANQLKKPTIALEEFDNL